MFMFNLTDSIQEPAAKRLHLSTPSDVRSSPTTTPSAGDAPDTRHFHQVDFLRAFRLKPLEKEEKTGL